MGRTNIFDMEGISSFLPPTYGRIIYCDYDNGRDGNNGLSKLEAVQTFAKAVSLARTNKDDVILLSSYSEHALSAMVTISKNRVHVIGCGAMGRRYGQRAKLSIGVTTAVTDAFAVKNTGVGNSFTNIKFMSSNTLATYAIGTVGEGGEYTLYKNCEFYNSAKLTSDTHAELVLNGDSAQFVDCTFGSLADFVVGDKVRPCVITTADAVTTGQPCRDVLFDGCRFWRHAGGTATAFVKIAADNDLERLMEFHDCQFVACKLSAAAPAVAIALGASLTKSLVILTGDTCAFNCTKIATGTGVISGLNVKVATATIGLQAT